MMKKNVLITGGTGFIGKQLTSLLLKNDFSVSILSRTQRQNSNEINYYKWDVSKKYIDEEALLNADYIINLAGENIAEKRWTTNRKNEIIDSRVQSIQLIYDVLKKNNKSLEAFISASGIGIYGAINGKEICKEDTTPENDFLGSTCQKWETATDIFSSLNIRTVKIRTGLVLGKNDGFLKKISPLFKLGIGSALGSGKQYMPWIHIDDLCAIYLESIINKNIIGSYNAAINDNTNNTLFSKSLAKVYGFSIWLPNIPSFLIKLILGEMSLIVLTGRRVSSEKIEKLGFQFQFKNLQNALENCLKE